MGLWFQKGDDLAFRMKGQGATEYLVLLAVVLIIALVSIALLGFFPGISTDAKITQSQSYWKAGRPFAILEHTLNAASANGTIVVQNADATGTIILTQIKTVSGNAVNTSTYSCLLYTSPSPRDRTRSRMPSSA